MVWTLQNKVQNVLICDRNEKILQLSSYFRISVSTTLNVLPPPAVKCQQITVSGKHLTVLKGILKRLIIKLWSVVNGGKHF